MGGGRDRKSGTGRSVFVVHGRNLAARDAMAAFLRAVDLKPIEWSEAAALTEAGTPRTFDSIRRAIAAAQAVVVLLTGDDAVRLREEYGHEAPGYQPRPNVLFEAGMAIAALGESRVLLVQTGAAREITDLAGLNYLALDNSPEARRSLVARLRAAGCELNDAGSAYLSPRTGGDFEASSLLDDHTGPIVLRRGGFDEHVVDSTISYTISNIKLLRELESQLVNPGASDLKYSYLGVAGATNWLNLAEENAYASIDPKEIISRAVSAFFSHELLNGRVVDFISLGPGDGRLDAAMLRGMARHCRVLNYYPLDLSIELLQQTVERTLPVCRTFGVRMKAILGDFLELRKYRPIFGYDDGINVVGLVGFTFGNYNEGALLGKVREAMNAGDFLLLDARLHERGNDVDLKKLRGETEEIVRAFSHTANNRFAFGPVEMATTAEFSTSTLNQIVSMEYTDIPNAYNIVTQCENIRARIRSSKRAFSHRRLDLAVTTFYHAESLVRFIEDRGFRVIDRQTDRQAMALLLQKI